MTRGKAPGNTVWRFWKDCFTHIIDIDETLAQGREVESAAACGEHYIVVTMAMAGVTVVGRAGQGAGDLRLRR